MNAASASPQNAAASAQPSAMPAHVAIIMDGNGRWAKKRLLPRIAGHKAGVETVRKIVKAAPDLGIKTLTLYAFSSENWKRPADEVRDLTGLLKHYLLNEIAELDKNGTRLRFIGDYTRFGPEVTKLVEEAAARTKDNHRLTLVLALNYGARDEILRATRKIAQAVAQGKVQPSEIDATTMAAALDTADLPDPDLIIRTSGEERLSNFLLWQSAYAEFYFTKIYWPDFDAAALAAAVASYAARERRFGGV